jgi:BMFP domain-containing protein YqiC
LEIKLDKKKFIENLVDKIQSITKNSPLKEVKNNLSSVIQSKLDEFNLVSREEFEVQKEVLRKTREKLEDLEKKIENKIK